MNENSQFTQDDQWQVIKSYFDSNGILSQQIHSYNKFLNSLIDIIEEEGHFTINVENQYYLDQKVIEENTFYYEYEFYDIRKQKNQYLQHTQEDTIQKNRFFSRGKAKKNNKEEQKGGYEAETMFPMQARLRDLYYEKNYFISLKQKFMRRDPDGEDKLINEVIYHKISLGSIPVMVRSNNCSLHVEDKTFCIEKGECEQDQGGYFIIKGNEKVIVAQERMAYNFVYVFKSNKTNIPWICEIRSVSEQTSSNPRKFELLLKEDKEFGLVIMANIVKYVHTPIPLFVLLRALGIQSDKELLECIFYDLNEKSISKQLELIKPSLEMSAALGSDDSREKILYFIGKRATKEEDVLDVQNLQALYKRKAETILNEILLPHINQKNPRRKAYFIGYMASRLLNSYIGKTGEDDRDHYGKKRLDMAGALLTSLFRDKFRQFKKKGQDILKRKINSQKPNSTELQKEMEEIFDGQQFITTPLRNALATGNWGKTAVGEVAKFGVAQVLKRDTSLFATLAHLRRVIAPIKASTKIAKPRQLHNTHWGMICPAETPEGQKIGIVKNLALLCHISLGGNQKAIESFHRILDQAIEHFDLETDIREIPKRYKIFFNGDWIGFTKQPIKVIEALTKLRRNQSIDESLQISFSRDLINREIKIYTDQGRCMRPLFIVDQDPDNKIFNQLRITTTDLYDQDKNLTAWKDLIFNKKQKDFEKPQFEDDEDDSGTAFIEFLDVEEEESALIAMDLGELKKQDMRFTHMEIHPAMILGVCASIIPFGDHNQGPRNTLQSAMGKQAMGLNSTNFNIRLDTLFHTLYYPQQPLASSRSMQFISAKDLPFGINAIVAIATFTGYNQEDSIIVNQSSIERGLFRSMFFRTYSECEDYNYGENWKETIQLPLDNESKITAIGGDYTKLDNDGIISPECPVKGSDVLIGKIVKIITETDGISKTTIKDKSKISRRTEIGQVDTVMITTNQKGRKLVKIRIRQRRIPQIGDKFASRHGQKGTVGMTYRQEDLPFNMNGISPDLIINPHCIPSRMTIGHMIECLSSKLASIKGVEGDATPFSGISMNEIADTLHELGYQRHGNETLYSPFTGNQITNKIFFGPTYYQRLRHLVDDKMYSRTRGPMVSLTRQPTHGRSRNGGLRFGEMERDCIISHGTSRFLKERTFEVSDKFRVHICSSCGLFATADLDNQIFYCKGCDVKPFQKGARKIVQVFLPYACKLLIQELLAMHIVPRLKVDINTKKFI